MFLDPPARLVVASLLCVLLVASGVAAWRQRAAGEETLDAAGEERPGPASSGAAGGKGDPGGQAGRGGASGGGGGASGGGGGGAVTDEAREPAAAAGSRGSVVVHVVGAVRAPGVYTLPAGKRVVDALAAAGGAAPDARLDLTNLAAPLEDGQKVYIPSERDARALQAAGAGAAPWSQAPWEAASAGAGGDGQGPGGRTKVDLNRADAAALEALPGIGPALARRIVEYRKLHGPFRRVEDVQQVPGIGPSKFQEIRGRLTVQ